MRDLYSRQFYAAQALAARASAEVVVPIVCELIQPGSVVDVGCGTGAWLSVFSAHGIADIQGYDGAWVHGSDLMIPHEKFTAVDLTQPLPIRRRYDLALSLEVAEHLPRASAATFIEALTDLSDVVLFSAAVPGQGGTNHINEQWPDYWARYFQQRGYEVVDAIRLRVWEDQRVNWWYAQNTLLFVATDKLRQQPKLQNMQAAVSGLPLRLVHPALYQQTLDAEPPGLSLGSVLRKLPGLIGRSIRSRMRL